MWMGLSAPLRGSSQLQGYWSGTACIRAAGAICHKLLVLKTNGAIKADPSAHLYRVVDRQIHLSLVDTSDSYQVGSFGISLFP